MPTTPIDDVLDHILQSCSISSLAVISRVSFHTRELALPHLLRKVYLDHNPQQILTFLNFIIDNAHDSDLGIISEPGRRVFELELCMFAIKTYVVGEFEPVTNQEHPISTWAHMLTKALSLMPNLRSFNLGDETEEIVTYSPDFGPTLLNLPHLTSLILRGIGRNASLSFGKAIDTLKGATKLQALYLSAKNGERDVKVVAYEGVGRFLSHYSVHLTDLCLLGLNLRTFLQEDEHRPDNSRVTFPAVGKLQIGRCEFSLEGLATAFPALHTFDDVFLYPNSPGPRQNQVSFPNLISIKGRYTDIYTILNSNASRDHVRRAVITSRWDDDGIATSAYAVPKAAQHLKSLHFSESDVKPLAWWQGFGETLPQLTYLDIELSEKNGLDLICNHIPFAIAQIPLEYISLLLKGYPVFDNPDNQLTAEEAIAIALSYAKGIPTLKYIDISTAPHTRYPEAPVTWWKVVRKVVSDGKVSLHVESLDAVKGRALREWYDLQAYGGIVV